MAITTASETLAFIETGRRMFENKTGLKHYAAQLRDLEEFIKVLSEENSKMKKALELIG